MKALPPDLDRLATTSGWSRAEAFDRAVAAGSAVLARLDRPDVLGVKLPGALVVGPTPEAAAVLVDLGCRIVARETDAAGPFAWVMPASNVGLGVAWPFHGPTGGVVVTVFSATREPLGSGVVRTGEPLPAALAGLQDRFTPGALAAAIQAGLRAEPELRAAGAMTDRSRRIPLRPAANR